MRISLHGRPVTDLPVIDPDEFRKILSSIGFQHALPNYVIFCDGSGSTPDRRCGFAALVYSQHVEGWCAEITGGALAFGTNQDAESWAAISGLERVLRREVKISPRRVAKVLIVTDSEHVSDKSRTPPRTLDLTASWDLLAIYRKHGLVVQYFHAKRETTHQNQLADWLSKHLRVGLTNTLASCIDAIKEGNGGNSEAGPENQTE